MGTLQIIAEEKKYAPIAAESTAGKLATPLSSGAQTVKAINLQVASSVHDSNERLQQFFASKLLPKLLTLRHADNTRPLISSLHRE